MSGGSSSSTNTSVNQYETDNSNLQQNDNQVALNLENVDDTIVNLTDQGAVKEAFDFGGDALDQAFDFGTQALNNSQDFGRDVIQETQETTRNAMQIAGNAQTNAFNKIKDIAASFTNTASSNTSVMLLALAGGMVVMLGALLWVARKR